MTRLEEKTYVSGFGAGLRAGALALTLRSCGADAASRVQGMRTALTERSRATA